MELLFLDDEGYQAERYSNALRDAGFSLTRARSVSEAETTVGKGSFDALVLDVMMAPEHLGEASTSGGFLSGIELARRLRENGLRVPIVFLTNSRDERIDQWCALQDSAAVLRKADVLPADFPRAMERLLKSLERQENPVDSIVFVHGLGGKARATWGEFPRLLREDGDFRGVRCYWFEYPTAFIRAPFGRRLPRVQTLADGLRTYIEHKVRGQNIALVCHSLGGIVARSFVLEEVKAQRLMRLSKLLLYAVPNSGASAAEAARYVTCWNRQVRQLSRDSDLIERLNEDWQQFRVHEHVSTQFVVAGQDKVVEESSARMLWGNDVDVVLDRGHRSVVKPERSGDMAFLILKRFVGVQ